ncbi:unnamed protein product, partial [Didymodactylos carnosus]
MESSQPSPPNELITVYLVFKQDQNSVKELESLFWKITDPDSDKYQQWLTRKEINKILKPHSKCYSLIKKWCEKQPFKKVIRLKNIVDRQQKFTDDNIDSLQQQLESLVVITPEFVIDYYKIPNVKKIGLPRNDVSQSSIQFLGEYYDEKDLQKYSKAVNIRYRPLASKHILGGINNQSNPGSEAVLDVEQMSGINPLAENWFINYESGVNPDGDGENFYTTILTLNQLDHLPQVLSISYGDPEIGL